MGLAYILAKFEANANSQTFKQQPTTILLLLLLLLLSLLGPGYPSSRIVPTMPCRGRRSRSPTLPATKAARRRLTPAHCAHFHPALRDCDEKGVIWRRACDTRTKLYQRVGQWL